MSRVIHDVKFLESPFPHGSHRDPMQFCCLPHWRDSFRVCKVIVGIKVVSINKMLQLVLRTVIMEISDEFDD